MCVRPSSESPTEELDQVLWKLFRMWESYTSPHTDKSGNGVEEFCRCVRARLEKLLKERAETGRARRQQGVGQDKEA